MPTVDRSDGSNSHVHPRVRSASVEDTVLVFHAGTGRYFTLVGDAAQAWHILAKSGGWALSGSRLEPFRSVFAQLKLLEDGCTQSGQDSDACLTPEIYEHADYQHLILEDPNLDLPLVGAFGEVQLASSSQRQLMNRIRVRTFIHSFEDAAQSFAVSQKISSFKIRIGSTKVRVNVPAADASCDIPMSLSFIGHDEVDDGTRCDFEVTLFDDSDGLRTTPTYFDEDWHLPLGTVDETVTGSARIAVDRHTQTVSVLSCSTGNCSVWTRDSTTLPYWFRATPLRLQLSWIADRIGLELLHAAAVNFGGKAVLFAGPSGSGKSSIALLLAGQGLPLIADDFLIASRGSVQGLYRRSKVHDAHLAQTIGVDWRVLNPLQVNQKRIVEPLRPLDSGARPIRAIVVPTLASATRMERMGASDALSAIAPASMSGLLGGNHLSLSRIAELVTRFPCYRLSVSEGVFDDPSLLLQLVSQIR